VRAALRAVLRWASRSQRGKAALQRSLGPPFAGAFKTATSSLRTGTSVWS